MTATLNQFTFLLLFISTTVLALAVLASHTILSTPSKVRKRSNNEGLMPDPCFISDPEAPAVLTPFNESIPDLVDRTAGLIKEAEALKQFLKTRYHLSNEQTDILDLQGWLDPEKMIANQTIIDFIFADPVEAFNRHLNLLTEYAMYVNETRSSGTIATRKSEDETRNRLQEFQIELYSCICSAYIVVTSTGGDVIYNMPRLDARFLSMESPLESAAYRTYITAQDGVKLMTFLHTVYIRLEESLS